MTYLEKEFLRKQRERAAERRMEALIHTIRAMAEELKRVGKLEEAVRAMEKVVKY